MSQEWLTFAGLVVSCITAVFAYLARKQSVQIHSIVNSRFDAQQAEIKALRQHIVELTTTPWRA